MTLLFQHTSNRLTVFQHTLTVWLGLGTKTTWLGLENHCGLGLKKNLVTGWQSCCLT